ncbi:hypothetical protein EXIGLDRAFT_734234 [Exidia glandulosa HHB12029]|uniref:Uncharacterized protein n=1 Tax=Exidia glandulosa HHB12029 TaxID=1314781 RepID=A0A165K8C6_EXIGL|nr:hypothetical protein EXIGLDRAFT_734234 [Exidia glandulosa HHB12029]
MSIFDFPERDAATFGRMCATALRIWRGSAEIVNAILDAILLPPSVSSATSIPLWEILVTGFRLSAWTGVLLELGDALAATLCLADRDGQNTIQTTNWIKCFLANFALNDIALLDNGWNSERFVHLIQHCTELRPQWRVGQHAGIDVYHEAALHGPCQACPEQLGYPPIAASSLA